MDGIECLECGIALIIIIRPGAIIIWSGAAVADYIPFIKVACSATYQIFTTFVLSVFPSASFREMGFKLG